MRLENEWIELIPPDTALAGQAAEYYRRNRRFLEAFEPARDAAFFTEACQRQILEREIEAERQKRGYRFYIRLREWPEWIIGMIGLNEVVWGAFCSCFMGYKLDAAHVNRGYMTMAVKLVTEYAFTCLHLHRIEANVMPRNGASLRVLEKCGFENEGLSKRYLKINGVWEDHIHMVKLQDAPRTENEIKGEV